MIGATSQDDPRTPTDVFAVSIQQARAEGWMHIPNATCGGGVVTALLRQYDGHLDLVTLPQSGLSEVRRIRGGPSHDRPRSPGEVLFKHQVPVHIALQWVLVTPWDNVFLQEWEAKHYYPPKEGVRDEH